MTDIIIIVVLVIILGGAIFFMRKEKDKGITCIGCPDSAVCEKRKNGFNCK